MNRDQKTIGRIHLAANLALSSTLVATLLLVIWAHLHIEVGWKIVCTVAVTIAGLFAAHRIFPRLTGGTIERIFGQDSEGSRRAPD